MSDNNYLIAITVYIADINNSECQGEWFLGDFLELQVLYSDNLMKCHFSCKINAEDHFLGI